MMIRRFDVGPVVSGLRFAELKVQQLHPLTDGSERPEANHFQTAASQQKSVQDAARLKVLDQQRVVRKHLTDGPDRLHRFQF